MPEHSPHPLRWIFHFCTSCYFTMSFVVRFTWPPLIPLAAPELQIDMSAAGAYMSAFFMGYVLTQIPGGLLCDRFGSRKIIALALLIEASGSLGVGLSSSYAPGFICRFLSGLGGGMVYSACIRYSASLFPAKELGLAFGLLMMAPSGVGVIVPNLLIPYLAEIFGWRGSFMVISLIAAFMAILAFLLVRDTPRQVKGRNPLAGLRSAIKEKNLIFLGLAGFWLIWITVCFATWGNSHIKNLGFELGEAGRIMLAFGLGGVIGSPLGGLLAPRVSSLKKGLILIFLLMPPCILLFSQAGGLLSLALTAFLSGLVIGLANPFTPLLMTLYAGKDAMGTAGGITGCLYQLGAVCGPFILGKSIDLSGSFTLAWILLAAAPLFGALCLLPLKEQRHP